MFFSGAEMVRLGAVQAERSERLQIRKNQPTVIKAIDFGRESQGEGRRGDASLLARFIRPRLKKPHSKTQNIHRYGVCGSQKKGEILDIYA